jgi:MFS family permease
VGLPFALFTVAFGTNIPTPLLVVYRDTLHLSETTLTAIFGSYALGLLPSLFLAGAVSDRIGRRRVAVPAAVLSGLVSLLFVAAAHHVPLLYAGRFLQGVVSGVTFAVASAWQQELAGRERLASAAARTSVAMTLGFSLAPLTSGLLAENAPWPTTLPYLVHVTMVCAGIAVMLRVPETVAARVRSGRLLALGLPPSGRAVLWTELLPTTLGVYTLPTVAITLFPLLADPDRVGAAYTGVLGGLTLGASALAAAPARRIGRAAAPIGTAVGAVGLLLGTVAVARHSTGPLIPAALLMGLGAGACLTCGLAITARIAPTATRGAVNSVFYAFAYAGFGAPLLLSSLVDHLGERPPLAGITVLFAATAAWLTYDLRRPPRGPRPARAPRAAPASDPAPPLSPAPAPVPPPADAPAATPPADDTAATDASRRRRRT